MRQMGMVASQQQQQQQHRQQHQCRLWNPVEGEDLWGFPHDHQVFQDGDHDHGHGGDHDLILPETSCNDPTLMEVEAEEAQQQQQQQEHEAEPQSPPPSFDPLHCSPCDRTLASKELFDRHILSELHFKRTSLGQWGLVSS